MMQPVVINKDAWITDGIFAGRKGIVVGADAVNKEVELRFDKLTVVTVPWDCVRQEQVGDGERE